MLRTASPEFYSEELEYGIDSAGNGINSVLQRLLPVPHYLPLTLYSFHLILQPILGFCSEFTG